MARQTGNSSRRAYIFVSLNLVLLLVFILTGVGNLHSVYNTTLEYDEMLREWLTLRLQLASMAPDESVEDLGRFQDFRGTLENTGSSEVLIASSRLSTQLREETAALESSWQLLLRESQAPRDMVAWRNAQDLLETQLLASRETIEEVVSTQDRALTVLLYCMGAMIAIVMVVFVVVEVENERARRLADENRMLARHALEAQEAEQTRIAHELHDSLAQELSTAILEIDFIAGTDVAERAQTREASRHLKDRLGGMVVWVRSLAHNLRPPELDAVGLVAALRSYCEERAAITPARIEFDAASNVQMQDSSGAITVFRIVQEAITNAVRHSAASLIRVEIAEREDTMVITVRDNGLGGVISGDNEPCAGLGIAGMRERTRMLGATIRISSRRGEGTTVQLHVPVRPS